MGRIFINYRRGDEPGFAGRLFDRLEQAFTVDRLFMDVDHIGPGQDFVRVLEDEVGKCDVLLAIIGKGWIEARDDNGHQRLESPSDFVRIEIESALKQGKRLIPVLVNDAQMPRGDDLPDSMKPLSRRNAVRLTHERFKSDAQGLIKILETALAEVEAARAAQTEEERRAAELTLKRKQDEESARAEEAEQRAQQRARQQAAQGLSPAEILKAEELANWDFIKSANDTSELRNHLARFPGGVTERYARTALEEILWTALGTTPDLLALESFVAEFPTGKRRNEAVARATILLAKADRERDAAERDRQEASAWTAVGASEDPRDYAEFLDQWPSGKFTEAAKRKLKALNKQSRGANRSAASNAAVFAAVGLIGGLIIGAESTTTIEVLGASFKLSDVLLSTLFTLLICAYSIGVPWPRIIGAVAFVGVAQSVAFTGSGLLMHPENLGSGAIGLAAYGALTSIPLLIVACFFTGAARTWQRISIALLISGISSALFFSTNTSNEMYLWSPLAGAASWATFAAYLGYMVIDD